MPVVGGVVGGAVVHWHGGGGVVWHGVGCIDGGVFGGMMVLEKEPPTQAALAKPTTPAAMPQTFDRRADRRVHVIARRERQHTGVAVRARLVERRARRRHEPGGEHRGADRG